MSKLVRDFEELLSKTALVFLMRFTSTSGYALSAVAASWPLQLEKQNLVKINSPPAPPIPLLQWRVMGTLLFVV